jgi:hypothetical protein
MIPTTHLKIVERVEIVDQHSTHATARTAHVLQQWWMYENGTEKFNAENGEWRDVPTQGGIT